MRVDIECVDQEIDYADFLLHDGAGYGFEVPEVVEDERFGAVCLYGLGLLVGPHEGVQRVVCGQVGGFPAGEQSAAQVA